ncbi:MAG: Flp pilus assembly protein CpaB [Pseudomonadota bacterium]
MRLIGILVLLAGIGLAGGALYYANGLFAKYQAYANQPAKTVPGETITKIIEEETIPVIVASATIRYGERVEEHHVRIIDWPADSVPQGAFTSPEDLIGDIMAERRVAMRQIDSGAPILESMVTGFGEDSRMAMRLGEGRRAFSIPINALSGVAGFVAPGDRVDIMLTESTDGSLKSRIILRDMQVIAVDQTSEEARRNARVGSTATLDVSTREAQILSVAQSVGKLTLTLRGAGDISDRDEDVEPVSFADIRGEVKQAPQAAPQAAKPKTVVRVRKGATDTTSYTFD